MIPKILHKIWFDFSEDGSGKNPPKKYIELEKECLKLNKGWTVMRWNEQKSLLFIKKYFPFFYEKFKNYKYPIQKVDAIRYFILYHYGGVYMDMDIQCRKIFDLFTEDKVYLVEESNSMNTLKFNNFLMASPKGHPFWLHIFDKLKENYDNRWYLRFLYILNSAGPGMVVSAYDSYKEKDKIIILPKDLFNPCDVCGTCNLSKSYIVHQGHATWTNGLEEYYMYIYCHRSSFSLVFLMCLFIIFLIYMSYRLLR